MRRRLRSASSSSIQGSLAMRFTELSDTPVISDWRRLGLPACRPSFLGIALDVARAAVDHHGLDAVERLEESAECRRVVGRDLWIRHCDPPPYFQLSNHFAICEAKEIVSILSVKQGARRARTAAWHAPNYLSNCACGPCGPRQATSVSSGLRCSHLPREDEQSSHRFAFHPRGYPEMAGQSRNKPVDKSVVLDGRQTAGRPVLLAARAGECRLFRWKANGQ